MYRWTWVHPRKRDLGSSCNTNTVRGMVPNSDPLSPHVTSFCIPFFFFGYHANTVHAMAFCCAPLFFCVTHTFCPLDGTEWRPLFTTCKFLLDFFFGASFFWSHTNTVEWMAPNYDLFLERLKNSAFRFVWLVGASLCGSHANTVHGMAPNSDFLSLLVDSSLIPFFFLTHLFGDTHIRFRIPSSCQHM